MKRNKFVISLILCIVMLLLVSVLACVLGSTGIPFFHAVRILLSKIPLLGSLISLEGVGATAKTIVLNLRLPRVLAASVVGGSLAVSGCALQGLFKNPMADTGVLGVSSGAGLGAAFAILLGLQLSFLGIGAITICAFFGALGTTLLVYMLSKIQGRTSTIGLLLSGLSVSALATAAQSLLMLMENKKIDQLYSWTMGSLAAMTYKKLLWAAPAMLLGCIGLYALARPLNLMLMGEEDAKHLGVKVQRVKVLVLIFTAFTCASAVSVSGTIAFVGLIIPHIVRMMTGPNHKTLMPLSFVLGGIFLVLVDLLSRTLIPPLEMPIGIFTSLLGAPFFLYLLRKKGVA